MNDFDIVISLNPAQPVAAAAKVVDGVKKIEHQSKETQKAINAVSLETKKAQEALAGIADKQTAKLKQGVAATAAVFGVLNEKLKLTESAFGRSIVEASKFASIGAQVGGAWGAAIGATIGLADSLGTALGLKFDLMTKGLDELEARQKRAGLAVSNATKAIEAQSKALSDAAQNASMLNRATDSLASGFKGLSSAAASAPDWLLRVGLGYDAFDPGKTKKKLDRINKGGGEKFDSGGYGRDLGLGDDFASRLASIAAQQKALDAAELRMQEALRPDDPDLEQDYAKWIQAQEEMNERTLQLAANTRAWNQELAASNTVLVAVTDGIKQAGASFVDTLVDGAFGADVSWKKWGEDMLKMFAKLILQASLLKAIGSPTGGVGGTATGLYKLLGFASGGVISPRGSGAADTETAMFRVAPRETIRIHTPEQEAAYRGGGGGGPVNVQVVNTPVDDRALLQALNSPAGSQTFLNQVRANRRAVKALLDD